MITDHLSVLTFTRGSPLTFMHSDCCAACFYARVLQFMYLMAVWTCVGLTTVRLYKQLLPLNVSFPSSCSPIPQHLSYWYPLPASDAPLFSKHSAWEICVWVPHPLHHFSILISLLLAHLPHTEHWTLDTWHGRAFPEPKRVEDTEQLVKVLKYQ